MECKYAEATCTSKMLCRQLHGAVNSSRIQRVAETDKAQNIDRIESQQKAEYEWIQEIDTSRRRLTEFSRASNSVQTPKFEEIDNVQKYVLRTFQGTME
jgi:phosphomevalonate kinase